MSSHTLSRQSCRVTQLKARGGLLPEDTWSCPPHRSSPKVLAGKSECTQGTENLLQTFILPRVTKPMELHVLLYSDIILCNIKYNLQKFLSSKPKETHLIFTFVYLN